MNEMNRETDAAKQTFAGVVARQVGQAERTFEELGRKQSADMKITVERLQKQFQAANDKLLREIYRYQGSDGFQSFCELQNLNEENDFLQEQIHELHLDTGENKKDDASLVFRLRRKNATAQKSFEAQQLINTKLEGQLQSLKAQIRGAEVEIKSMSSARCKYSSA